MVYNSADDIQCGDVSCDCQMHPVSGVEEIVCSVGMGTRPLLLRAISLVLDQRLMHSRLHIPIVEKGSLWNLFWSSWTDISVFIL